MCVVFKVVTQVPKPKERPKRRRDKRNIEDGAYISVDTGIGEKVVKKGKKFALAKGELVSTVLEEDEYVENYEVVFPQWARSDEAERNEPRQPVRAVLQPDESITENRRLPEVWKPRELLPPAARVKLQPDEYVDEKGVIRTERAVRKKLEETLSVDFVDVCRGQAGCPGSEAQGETESSTRQTKHRG